MRSAALLLAILVASAGCMGGERDADEPGPGPNEPPLAALSEYDYIGEGCIELALFLQVPTANVQPHVPAGYELIQAAGKATLTVAAARCEHLQYEEGATDPGVHSDVGVMIRDPEDPAATSMYALWFASNRPGWVENMARVGAPAHPAPEASVLRFGLVAADVGQAHIPWETSPYRMDLTGGRGTLPATAYGSDYWNEGSNGRTHLTYDLMLASAGPAQGTIFTESGTLLAQILGGAQLDGEGLITTFSYNAHIEVVE